MRVLRRFFPGRYPCPKCRSTEFVSEGSSRGGGLRYRRCSACQYTFAVGAIAEEVDPETGEASKIRIL